ncbi:hypothetical protein ACJIZ3_007541 [Penstemon smallii]|uniref:Uncharacterized protein n=1 Tax=Penstemon smallii TaxID=265156 RepID=A0ABD3T7A4_9LAMI
MHKVCEPWQKGSRNPLDSICRGSALLGGIYLSMYCNIIGSRERGHLVNDLWFYSQRMVEQAEDMKQYNNMFAPLRVQLVEADDSTHHIISALLLAAVSDELKAWETLKGRFQNIDLILIEVDLPYMLFFPK